MSKHQLKEAIEEVERLSHAKEDFISWFGSPTDEFKETDWPDCEVRFPKYLGTSVAAFLNDFRIIKLRNNSIMKEIVKEAYETINTRLEAAEHKYSELIEREKI